jgi:hypothetical protein
MSSNPDMGCRDWSLFEYHSALWSAFDIVSPTECFAHCTTDIEVFSIVVWPVSRSWPARISGRLTLFLILLYIWALAVYIPFFLACLTTMIACRDTMSFTELLCGVLTGHRLSGLRALECIVLRSTVWKWTDKEPGIVFVANYLRFVSCNGDLFFLFF